MVALGGAESAVLVGAVHLPGVRAQVEDRVAGRGPGQEVHLVAALAAQRLQVERGLPGIGERGVGVEHEPPDSLRK